MFLKSHNGPLVTLLIRKEPLNLLSLLPTLRTDSLRCLKFFKGDKSLKAEVLVPCKPEEKLVVDEYPDVTFTETRDPVVDKDGKLITKVLASWSANNPEVNNHVGVIVPSQNRPVVKTVAENRANTIVLRLTADVRFSCKAGWNKFKGQPGTVARQWCVTAAPSIKDSLVDSWSWELWPGVVKGLLRVQKCGGCWQVAHRQWTLHWWEPYLPWPP